MNRKTKFNLLPAVTFLLAFGHAMALTTDKDQDIQIEADNAEMDDKQGITIYRGNVVVTQGSIRIKGDIMTVTFNADKEMDTVIVEGKPAQYRQLPDNKEVYDEAEALRMEYYTPKSLIVLIDNAQVRQEGLRFSGSHIEYDTLRSQVKAKGKPGGAEKPGASPPSGADSRVKITIKGKKKSTDNKN